MVHVVVTVFCCRSRALLFCFLFYSRLIIVLFLLKVEVGTAWTLHSKKVFRPADKYTLLFECSMCTYSGLSGRIHACRVFLRVECFNSTVDLSRWWADEESFIFVHQRFTETWLQYSLIPQRIFKSFLLGWKFASDHLNRETSSTTALHFLETRCPYINVNGIDCHRETELCTVSQKSTSVEL